MGRKSEETGVLHFCRKVSGVKWNNNGARNRVVLTIPGQGGTTIRNNSGRKNLAGLVQRLPHLGHHLAGSVISIT